MQLRRIADEMPDDKRDDADFLRGLADLSDQEAALLDELVAKRKRADHPAMKKTPRHLRR